VAGPLLVVDAPSLLFRAFYALPKTIVDGRKRPVNALLGTANMLLLEVARHEPRAVVLCFGPDAADYRVELYPEYHADRDDVPDELAPQFEEAPGFFDAFGWSTVSHDSLEADDLLGSLAATEAKAGGHALILTGDRDLYQCAGDRVTVLYVRTGGSRGAEPVDAAEVKRRYGVPPELVPDFIALRGDPSDGIPGAPGIGEKKAADLLARHGSLEAAIANAVRERPARVCAALRENADELRAFREIATLRRVRLKRPRDRPTDLAGGAEAAERLGMNRLAKRLRSGELEPA
jgi:5'-3' exonuclease